MTRKKNTVNDFWKKVDVKGPNNCWEWRGGKNKLQYGTWQFEGKKYLTHRWIYQYIHNKILPSDILICHSCDNPSCVNPAHLWEGTNLDNIRDMVSKNRQTLGKINGMSILTEEQIIAIRKDKRKQKDIAKDYNISISTISLVKNKKRWKHIP